MRDPATHSEHAATILLVDSESSVREQVAESCREAGYRLLTVPDGRQAMRVFFESRPDMVITDVRLPGTDGFDLLQRMREVSEVPIIVFTALDGEAEKVRGLRLGADDYMVKPAGMAELMARVDAALRRVDLSSINVINVYRDAAIAIDFDRHEVLRHGMVVDLTPTEYRLLVYLVQRAGKVISLPELLEGAWGSPHYAEGSVKWHMANLRGKIEDDRQAPRRIVTVWGAGYRYDRPD